MPLITPQLDMICFLLQVWSPLMTTECTLMASDRP